MDFQPTEEQQMLREAVRTFAENELRPIAFTLEGRGDYPPEIYREMAAMGLFGMTLPEEYEGGGRTPVDAIMVMEEIGRVDPVAAGIVFGANFGPIRAVAVYGTDQQKQKYIPPVCRGEASGVQSGAVRRVPLRRRRCPPQRTERRITDGGEGTRACEMRITLQVV